MKTRQCPVTPDVCSPVTGWEPFCVHVYETHTDPSLSEKERTAEVDKILHLSPAERRARQAELSKRAARHSAEVYDNTICVDPRCPAGHAHYGPCPGPHQKDSTDA